MKKIQTSQITGAQKAPYVKDTHNHYKEAIEESTASIVKGIAGSYTTGDIIVLEGCVVSATIPGSSTITAGSVFYNGEIYTVDAATIPATGSQTLVWQVVTTYISNDSTLRWSDLVIRNLHQIDKMALVAGASGSGLANYNGSTVKRLNQSPLTTESITFNTGWTDAGSYISVIGNGDVEINFQGTTSTGGTTSVSTLPSWARPSRTKRFTIADYNGTNGPSELMVLNIDSTGEIKLFKQADGTKPSNRDILFTIRYNIYR